MLVKHHKQIFDVITKLENSSGNWILHSHADLIT